MTKRGRIAALVLASGIVGIGSAKTARRRRTLSALRHQIE
jgi:hypothetical protein